MNEEQRFFINILADHIKEKKTDCFQKMNWEKISKLSRIHQVEGIVYTQCKAFMPENLVDEYSDYYSKTLYSYANRKALMNGISNLLKESGIAFFTVKGFMISKYYPISAMRTMGDCDIVVHRYDFPATVELLRANGFDGNDIISAEQWECEKNGFHFEVHDKLLQEGEFATNRQAAFFNEFDQYVDNGEIDPSFHFLFLLMHLRKHFLNRGVGIRQFMDLALMSQKEADLQWDWIETTLFELGLSKYAHVCYLLVEKWFGVIIPVEKEELSDESYEILTEKILNNGVFGFDNNENIMANAHTALLKAKGPIWFRRLTVLFHSIFLSYEIMRGYADCTFLDGRPWLLPIAWAKRIITIIGRDDHYREIEVIKNSFISTDELNDRKRILKLMELL